MNVCVQTTLMRETTSKVVVVTSLLACFFCSRLVRGDSEKRHTEKSSPQKRILYYILYAQMHIRIDDVCSQ